MNNKKLSVCYFVSQNEEKACIKFGDNNSAREKMIDKLVDHSECSAYTLRMKMPC